MNDTLDHKSVIDAAMKWISSGVSDAQYVTAYENILRELVETNARITEKLIEDIMRLRPNTTSVTFVDDIMTRDALLPDERAELVIVSNAVRYQPPVGISYVKESGVCVGEVSPTSRSAFKSIMFDLGYGRARRGGRSRAKYIRNLSLRRMKVVLKDSPLMASDNAPESQWVVSSNAVANLELLYPGMFRYVMYPLPRRCWVIEDED